MCRIGLGTGDTGVNTTDEVPGLGGLFSGGGGVRGQGQAENEQR